MTWFNWRPDDGPIRVETCSQSLLINVDVFDVPLICCCRIRVSKFLGIEQPPVPSTPFSQIFSLNNLFSDAISVNFLSQGLINFCTFSSFHMIFFIFPSVFLCIYGFQASKYLEGAKHIPVGINPIPKSRAVLFIFMASFYSPSCVQTLRNFFHSLTV